MNRIIAITAALAFSSAAFAQDKKAEPTPMQKIEKAGAANTKAVNEKRAKDKADADAREKASKKARDEGKGMSAEVPASVKKTADGIDKKRSEDKSPAPKR